MTVDPAQLGRIHDGLCRCRACKPGLGPAARRPAPRARRRLASIAALIAIVAGWAGTSFHH